MFLSVTHRILGPIALLLVIGTATTAWISIEAVQTHDDLQEKEQLAYEIVATVEHAKDAQRRMDEFIQNVLSFDQVIPRAELDERFQSLNQDLNREISQLEGIGNLIGMSQSVAEFRAIEKIWTDEAKIALGLNKAIAVPTTLRLDQLAQRAERSLRGIYEKTRSMANVKTDAARGDYVHRVKLQFFSMLVVFGVFGIFFLSFGRRFARTLRALAKSMEQIRAGNFSAAPALATSQDEIGQIAKGVHAFGETLQELTVANEQVKHLAMHDQLTGLPNRRTLEEHLKALLAGKPDDREGRAAVLHIDLDRFKQVNDMFGHAAGDEILRHASHAMEKSARKTDLVARIGGDEFVIVLESVDKDEVEKIAERVICAVSQPIEIWNDMVNVGASVGIAFVEDTETDPERILANADMALYIAKGAGRGRCAFYSAETRRQFESDMSLLRELRVGLDRGEIIAFFQPQIDAATGRITGVEALARWDHPVRGILAPGEFIGLAFDNGLGERVSEIMLQEAISAILEWRGQGISVPRVSVNFSAKQLRTNGLTEYLDDALFKAGLLPQNITIEVLESVLFGDDADPAHATIASLKRRGYRIELDDFGTGHASISNLRKFKVDGVKIDRFFIAGVDKDPEQEMILRTLIDLCGNLGIGCLAEGVETEEEKQMLLSLGCSRFQGFGIARPMPRTDVAEWIASFSALPRVPKAV